MLEKARVSTSHLLILSQQMSVGSQTRTALSALQAPRKCSVHNCAPSASDTSRVFRSLSVNNNFHEQGMDSRPLRDKRTTAALARERAFKYTDNVARVTNQVREPTEKKNKEKICLHCPAQLPAQSGQKGKQARCAVPAPTEGRVWSPHKHAPQNGCETTQGRERIRQFMFAAALRTKHKNFPTLLDDVSSKLTRCLVGHFTALYLTVRGSVRNDN